MFDLLIVAPALSAAFQRTCAAANPTAALLDLFTGNVKTSVGGWNARVNSGLQQHFFQIAEFQFMRQSGAQVKREFFPASQRCRYR
jgi:hypothetical protein